MYGASRDSRRSSRHSRRKAGSVASLRARATRGATVSSMPDQRAAHDGLAGGGRPAENDASAQPAGERARDERGPRAQPPARDRDRASRRTAPGGTTACSPRRRGRGSPMSRPASMLERRFARMWSLPGSRPRMRELEAAHEAVEARGRRRSRGRSRTARPRRSTRPSSRPGRDERAGDVGQEAAEAVLGERGEQGLARLLPLAAAQLQQPAHTRPGPRPPGSGGR